MTRDFDVRAATWRVILGPRGAVARRLSGNAWIGLVRTDGETDVALRARVHDECERAEAAIEADKGAAPRPAMN